MKRTPAAAPAPTPMLVLALAGTLLLAATGPAGATEVKNFQVQSQKAFLAGTLEGVSVDPTGRLRLAERAERITALTEPFLLSAAEHPDGWVVGTGNDGKVLLVTPDGETRELFSAGEGQVFAVHADADGTVWAGVSPRGAVYRISPGGEGEDAGAPAPWFETGEIYVWDLARSVDGALLVATGTSGKLFRVTGEEEAEGSLLYDSDDTHVRSLLVRGDGSVVLGTAGEGLILRVDPDGSARTLYDAPQPEVVALADGDSTGAGDGGVFYAAVIASEASQVDLSAAAAAARKKQAGENGGKDESDGAEAPGSGGGEVEVSVAPAAAGSRPSGFQGKRAQVLSISGAGVVETVWGFDDETVFDLLWARDRLWVATGLEGKLYSFDGERMVLEQDLDERQVVALLPDAPGPAFATTNAPALYRLSDAPVRTGTYTSAALDAGGVSRFGTLRWWGDTPRGSDVKFSVRSGLSTEPDATWSGWSDVRAARAPRERQSGGELEVQGVPQGRYVQWRALIEGPAGGSGGRNDPASPRIDGVELSYRQLNLRPEIASFETLEPGQILVPAGFNPTIQVFEPVHPNREGIFTTLEQAAASGDARTKALWKKGYRAFRWKAEDPNGDELIHSIEFRPLYPHEGSEWADSGEEGWFPVAEDLSADHYNFDATVLPDGTYRFRLVVSDGDANPPGEGLVDREISEPVIIDNSGPDLVEAVRRGGVVQAVVQDRHNPLRSAEFSVDAGEWRPAPTGDGLLDARREALEIPVAAPEDRGGDGPRLLLLRVTDAAHNVTTIDLSDQL